MNLILGLATASLGFALSLVKDKDFAPGCSGKHLLLLGLVSLVVSISLGVWCVINRLHDFSKTAQNAKDGEALETLQSTNQEREEISARLEHRRRETERLGENTWTLLYWQIGAFCLGAFLLVDRFS
ncbi:MAG: hypothetical protein HY236_06075 [Acidobacteria bacterium]|nr:hypothetical protein [Acidobacteriota bacterium]